MTTARITTGTSSMRLPSCRRVSIIINLYLARTEFIYAVPFALLCRSKTMNRCTCGQAQASARCRDRIGREPEPWPVCIVSASPSRRLYQHCAGLSSHWHRRLHHGVEVALSATAAQAAFRGRRQVSASSSPLQPARGYSEPGRAPRPWRLKRTSSLRRSAACTARSRVSAKPCCIGPREICSTGSCSDGGTDSLTVGPGRY